MEKFYPSKFRAFFLNDQSDEVQDESRKENVFIGNAVAILMMIQDTRSLLTSLDELMLLDVP